MTFFAQSSFRTARGTTVRGAILGFILALAFGCGFTAYAIARSSLQIILILSPKEGLYGTLVANAFGILLPALSFTLVLGVGAAMLQSIALLFVHGVTSLINPHQSPRRAAWIGLLTAGLLASAVQLMVKYSLGIYFEALWPTGYFFWLGLPSLIFVGVTTWLSPQMTNRHLADHHIGRRASPIDHAVA